MEILGYFSIFILVFGVFVIVACLIDESDR